MSLTTSQAFASFLGDLTATTYQTDTFIPGRRDFARNVLAGAFPSTSNMPLSRVQLMGSAAKNTIIRPFDDIDVLAIFSNDKNAYENYRWNSQDFLYRVRNAYDGYITQRVGARGQAVRVFYESGGHVDVAPVFWSYVDTYLLPAGDGSWLQTAPLKASQWYRDKNKDLGYHLGPLVRLLKAWNRSHSSNFRSFHLETMAASSFGSMNGNRQDALLKFFQWAPSHIDVYDPGQHSGNLSSYLGWTARTTAATALSTAAYHAEKAIAAEADGDHSEAKRQWRIVLGSDFPD